MSLRRTSIRTLLLAIALAVPISASAAPITYGFSSGTITYRATVGTTQLAVATVAMTGSFATFDATTITLDDFAFDTGASGMLTLSQPYANITSVALQTSSIAPAAGYSPLFGSDLGNGQYMVVGGPGGISGVIDTTDIFGATTTQSFSVGGANALSTTVTLVGSNSLEVTGLTLLAIPAFGGATQALVIKADIVFNGTNPIPEPSAAALMFVGMLVVGRAVRR